MNFKLRRKAWCVVAAGVVCGLLWGCSRTVYVPVESVKTEYRNAVRRDSIRVVDSTVVRLLRDTVWIDRWRREYKDRVVKDTVFVRDSVAVPYPVEKELTRWEEWRMEAGGVVMVLLLVMGWGWWRRKD